MHKKPNFVNYTISRLDIGKEEIEVRGFMIRMPFRIKKKDVGKRVAVNLNGRV